MIGRRESAFKNADSASSVGPQQVITFTLPPSNTLVPPSSIYYGWRVSVGTAAADIEGNVQRLIRRIRVMDTNGSIFEDIDDYNMLQEVVMNTHIPEDVQYKNLVTEGMFPQYTSGVSTDISSSVEGEWFPVSYTVAGSTYDHTGGATENLLTLAGTTLTTTFDIQIGDILKVYSAVAGQGGVGVVTAITGATTLNIGGLSAVDITTGNLTQVQVWRPKYLVRPTNGDANAYRRLIATTGKYFTFQLRGSGIHSMSKFLPLAEINGLRIEFTLESPNTALIGTANATYTITESTIYYDALTPSDQLASTLSKARQSGKMNLTFATFDTRRATVSSGTQLNVELTKPLFRIKGVYACKRLSANLSLITADSFATNSSGLFDNDGNATSYYQLTHNGVYYPVQRVQHFEHAYQRLKQCVGTMGDIEYRLDFWKYRNGPKFYIGQNFESLHETGDEFSGVSTKSNKSIIFNCQTSSSQSDTWNFFTSFMRNISLLPSGLSNVTE
jgi:hypothetical protein